MREIEVKARIGNLQELVSKLDEKNISLSDELKQHDVVYSEPGKNDNDFGANWLRVRTENDTKAYFTLKRSVVGHLDSIEHETVVEDAQELEEIIKLIGYELYSDLTKVRRKARCGDIEICVDSVPGLGDFIEAEKLMTHDSDHDEVVGELWRLLETFGVSKKDEVFEGYDVLERRQRGL